MPEYLAPGVFVEEVDFRANSIEGVSTSTTAFAGATLRGPIAKPDSSGKPAPTPELLTSFLDFQRIYGGLGNLTFSGTPARPNYMALAVKAYFDNGGSRLYVARVAGGTPATATTSAIGGMSFTARSPGSGGNGSVTIALKFEPATVAGLSRAPAGSVVRTGARPAAGGGGGGAVTIAYAVSSATGVFPASVTDTNGLDIVTVTVTTTDSDGATKTYDGMGLDANNPRFIGNVMAANPTRRVDQLQQTYAVVLGATPPTATALVGAIATAIGTGTSTTLAASGGTDGSLPGATDYDPALDTLQAIEDISIVAAPGSSADDSVRQGVYNSLIAHCELRRSYRIAVLDSSRVSSITDAQTDRAPLDSSYAALYAPWVVVPNPLYVSGDASTSAEIAVPPSGAVTGVYARTDVARGVFKAPANEVVMNALRYDLDINFSQQEVLNPIGINCLRSFPNRGNRVWGARTLSSDPQWKYVPVRRYFNYLERSIDIGTQWAVFEPNGEALWSNIRDTISDFLVNEWRSGALLGSSTKEAFFVRCDRSTMDQSNLDNGQLICLIGVAVVKPAEFVIFRIGQKTADSRS